MLHPALIAHMRGALVAGFALLAASCLPLGSVMASSEAPVPHGEGRLFAVSKGEGAPVSYLFGTMHVNDRRVLAVPKVVRGALSESKTLFLEVILDEAAKASIQEQMMLSDDRSLYDIVGTDLFYRIADRLEEIAPRGAINRLSPVAVMNLLRQATRQMDEENPDKPVLDEQIRLWAEEGGLNILALEKVEDQLAIFSSLSDGELVKMIEASLEQSYAEAVRNSRAVLDFYLAGDLAGLLRISARIGEDPGMSDVNAQVLEALIDDRNEKMVERLLTPLAEGKVFVAVGALHLPGEHGVLHLLESEGYRVTRVY